MSEDDSTTTGRGTHPARALPTGTHPHDTTPTGHHALPGLTELATLTALTALAAAVRLPDQRGVADAGDDLWWAASTPPPHARVPASDEVRRWAWSVTD